MKQRSLTEGNITKNLIYFALPMMVGNLLQQCYNVADTLIVGRFLGANALAAVGSSYTLMTFLTSIMIGMCMGSSAVFSIAFGEKNSGKLKAAIVHSFVLIGIVTLILNVAAVGGLGQILVLLQVPEEVMPFMREYLQVIFLGIAATFLYNFFAALLRAVGNSMVPLVFLGISAVMNIVLDLVFILVLGRGVRGAAEATVLAQYVSGIGIVVYTLGKFPQFRISKTELRFDKGVLGEISSLSFLTCIQQSVMNFGILMVQGLVNSFGSVVMAAFAAAVKIDSFAYMPVQDFGNAFSTFVAQNYGAGKGNRIREGIKKATAASFVFCLVISAIVCMLARPLMQIFVKSTETEIISVGVGYLRIEGAFYFGIGLLFLLYGFYRAVKRPGMSVVLTVFSLGTRVLLAYILSAVPVLGVKGIWISVPVGWAIADIAGILYYMKNRKKLVQTAVEEEL